MKLPRSKRCALLWIVRHAQSGITVLLRILGFRAFRALSWFFTWDGCVSQNCFLPTFMPSLCARVSVNRALLRLPDLNNRNVLQFTVCSTHDAGIYIPPTLDSRATRQVSLHNVEESSARDFNRSLYTGSPWKGSLLWYTTGYLSHYNYNKEPPK